MVYLMSRALQIPLKQLDTPVGLTELFALLVKTSYLIHTTPLLCFQDLESPIDDLESFSWPLYMEMQEMSS